MQRAPLIPAVVGILAASLLFVGCGSDPGPGAPCGDRGYSCGQLCDGVTPPSACGLDCSNAGCPVGFYCGADETCTADCSGADDALCGDGTCSSSGVCTGPDGVDAGGVDVGRVDLGPPVDAGRVDQGDGVCARVSVEASRVTPNVIFLIDRSGSMGWELDLSDGAQCPLSDGHRDCYDNGTSSAIRDLSRWRGLRSTLIGTSAAPAVEGLIGDLQSQVRFGAVTYHQATNLNTNTFQDGCMALNVLTQSGGAVGVVDPGAVPSARDVIAGNATNDIQYLRLAPNSGTPTGPAIDYVIANLAPSVANSADPTILILATDGAPTSDSDCNGYDYATSNAQDWSVNAVQRAYAAGIRTFVLTVADETEIAQDHVDDLANAGLGRAVDASPAAPSWRVDNVAALNAALSGIIGNEISCTVELAGQVPTWSTDPCAGGTIELVEGTNRTTLQCAPGNGWQLVGPSTVEIMGTACNALKAATNATLDASFPCDTVIFG